MSNTTTATKHTITLFISGRAWMAKYSDPAIADLFGTDTIETAFFASAPAAKVLAEIAALNPEYAVSL